MSFYATIAGDIRYPTQAALDAALAQLLGGGWINERNVFVDERRRPRTPGSTVDGFTLHLPMGLYRNLAGFLLTLVAGTAHKVAWASTDGTYSAGLLVDGRETAYDLQAWAAEYIGPPEDDESHSDYWAEAEADFVDWVLRQ